MHLETIYTRVGYFAFMGFSQDEVQKPNEGIFQIWVSPPATKMVERLPNGRKTWEAAVSETFNKVEWKDKDAVVTIQVTPPLRDPKGLLESLEQQLSQNLESIEEEEYICPCGHKAGDHYFGSGYCEKCGCPQLGEPLENWEEHIITNVGGDPGGFTIVE